MMMLRKSLIYIVLWLLLAKVNCQMMRTRRLHTATFIDNKLYILGGFGAEKEFVYLDFSGPFNTQNLLWQNLSSINIVPGHYGAISVKGGTNNNTLFLYGGAVSDVVATSMALVYTFYQQKWSVPSIINSASIANESHLTGFVDDKRKMYLWGGLRTIDRSTTNEMLILDTISLNWGRGSLVGAPTPRYNYGASLLPDQSIVYIGGYTGSNLLSLDPVYIYDTINDSWTVRQTSGKIPSIRDAFSAVLGLDGQRIIIFGGTPTVSVNPSSVLAKEDALYVLDTINFEWYVPKISGNVPVSRTWHKANVIGKYMVISFGIYYDQLIESDILLLDISNNDEYRWTNAFDPSPPPSISTPSTPSASLTPSALSSPETSSPLPPPISAAGLAGAIVGSLVGGILLSFGCFFLYKRNKNNQKQKNPGNENREIFTGYESTTNHESITISPPVINNYYGRPIANAERPPIQNIDNLKNEIRQEIKDEIKQEIIQEMLQNLQNNNQASSSNINYKK